MGGDDFSLLGLFYLAGAGFTVYQLFLHRREFWDSRLSAQDRQIAAGVAFFLLVPVGVLLHEFGHMFAAWSTGSQVLGLHYFLYWGYVEYIPARPDPLLEWYVALAGNFVSYLLGIGCLLVGLRMGVSRPVVPVVLVVFGVLELTQTLIAYPLMSLDPTFHGDWDTIYSFEAPIASGVTLALHLLSLAAFVFLLRDNKKANILLRGY